MLLPSDHYLCQKNVHFTIDVCTSAACFLSVLLKFALLEVFGHKQRGFQRNSFKKYLYFVSISPSSLGSFLCNLSALRTTLKPTFRCFGKSVFVTCKPCSLGFMSSSGILGPFWFCDRSRSAPRNQPAFSSVCKYLNLALALQQNLM